VAGYYPRATFEDTHTITVQKLRLGMILFIVSEVMFSLFWAFFHSSVAPVHNLGGVWPLRLLVQLTHTLFH
jgi:cytochrome c oxidase subunit 3